MLFVPVENRTLIVLCAIHRHQQQQQQFHSGAAAGPLVFFLRQEIQDALAVSLKNRTETQSNFMCLYEKESPLVYIFNTISACTYSLSLSLKTLKAIYPIHVLKKKNNICIYRYSIYILNTHEVLCKA